VTSSGGGGATAAGAAGTADGGGASGAGGGASGAGGAGGSASGAGGAGGGFTYEPITGDQFDDMLLYEGNPPNFKTGAPKEALNGLGQFTNVSVPMLRRFAMDGGKATGFGYLVFPGGGYSLVDMQLHVAELAKRVAPLGVAVFGLKYRVGGGTSNAPRDALLDAKRAIRIVKQNAARWGVDVARLGVIGYSAGSHMTLNLAANFDAGNAASADPIEKHSSRPAFIGSMATWAMGAKTSPFTFPNDVPPAFFCHAENDKTAPIELPKAVEALIRAQGVATKLDFYATGAHSTCHPGDASMEGRNWPDKFWPWVQTVIH
jgi:endo-1,4-beta-xylanase